MYEHIHEAPEEFQLSPFEDGISNRQRRSLRQQSTSTRRQQARRAQAASGMRLRIWRKVLNEEDFAAQLRVWHQPHQNGTARRKNYRSFSLTVFDTSQQPLRSMEQFNEDDLADTLRHRHLGLFEQLAPIATQGAMRFGGNQAPFLALSFASDRLDSEQKVILQTVAPELWLDDSHQNIHRPHVSLGKITVANAADRERITHEIQGQLDPVLPKHVVFGPINIDISHPDGYQG